MTSQEKTLKRVRSIRLPEDVDDLLGVSLPSSDVFKSLSPTETRRVVEDLTAVASRIILGQVTAEELHQGFDNPAGDPLEPWRQAFFRITAWWCSAMVALQKVHRHAHPANTWNKIVELLNEKQSKSSPHHVVAAQQVYLGFEIVLLCAELVRLFRGPLPSSASFERNLDYGLHDGLMRLWMLRGVPGFVEVVDYAVGELLAHLPDVYEREPHHDELLHGPFSRINLPDFIRMAKRDEHVIRKYGKGNVARAFEQQLALIVQSLGAVVVQTRPGERTIDLYCLSSHATHPFAFLIEAKTSKRAYGLPPRDERALIEYIEESRRLRTLPRLRFVLLVAAEPAAAISNRIRRLEAACGVPVRFLSAKGLAKLRDALLGPQALEEFAFLIADSPPVIPDEIGAQVMNIIRRQDQAHETLVRTMLGLSSTDSPHDFGHARDSRAANDDAPDGVAAG